MPSVYQRFVDLRLPECVFREAAVMQMLCSRWWILPKNMETDRFILPHARDLKLRESIWKIWIKLMRCSSRLLIIFRLIKMRQVPGIRHQEPEMSVHVSETESVLLAIIIQQLLRRKLKRRYFLMIFILKLRLQAVPMTVLRRECTILELSA